MFFFNNYTVAVTRGVRFHNKTIFNNRLCRKEKLEISFSLRFDSFRPSTISRSLCNGVRLREKIGHVTSNNALERNFFFSKLRSSRTLAVITCTVFVTFVKGPRKVARVCFQLSVSNLKHETVALN